MKSILQSVKTGEISVEDIPPPVLVAGSVLVRNHHSLVSAGTEKAVMEFSNANYLRKAFLRPDLLRKVINRAKNDGLYQTFKVVGELVEQRIQLGYSSSGVVESVGEYIHDVKAGQRVACAGLFAATHSELVSVPRNLVVPIPDGLEHEHACFVTLGAIALQGVRLANLSLSENVVVYGLGLVGMIAAQMALAAGCRVVGLDIDHRKVAMAEQMGFRGVIIDPGMESAVMDLTEGYGADKVLICAATKSNDPIERIPSITRQKGLVVVVGDVKMDIPRRAYYEKEIDIRISRSYGPGRYDLSYEQGGIDYPYAYVRWTENRNMASALDLMARKRVDVSRLITHRFDLDHALEAYRYIDGKRNEPYLGMVIRYPPAPDQSNANIATVRYAVKAGPLAEGLNFGVIGAGNFGKAILLPAFARQAGVRFVGICTASGVSAASVAKKYGMAFATSDPAAVLENSEINALIVATRHDSHARYVVRGLELGKAVYVEKPLATTEQDLEAIREVFERKRREGAHPFLMVGFNRRFSPLAVCLRKAFGGGGRPISVVYRVNAGFVPETEWVQDPVLGGGRVVGEVCHFIDFVNFLVDELPTAVSANALRRNGRAVKDIVSLNLEYPNGSLGTIHYFSNGDPAMPKEYVEVFGGKACAQLINFRKLKIYGVRAEGKTSYLNQVKGFEQEAQAFVSAARGGGEMPIPFEALYATTRATFLAEQALGSGRRLDMAQTMAGENRERPLV